MCDPRDPDRLSGVVRVGFATEGEPPPPVCGSHTTFDSWFFAFDGTRVRVLDRADIIGMDAVEKPLIGRDCLFRISKEPVCALVKRDCICLKFELPDAGGCALKCEIVPLGHSTEPSLGLLAVCDLSECDGGPVANIGSVGDPCRVNVETPPLTIVRGVNR